MTAPAPTRRERLAVFARFVVRSAVTVLLVLTTLVLAARIYLERGWRPERAENAVSAPWTAVEELETIEHAARLESALEVYRLEFERYPRSLQDLVDENLIGERALTWPGDGTEWFYESDGDTWTLLPPTF